MNRYHVRPITLRSGFNSRPRNTSSLPLLSAFGLLYKATKSLNAVKRFLSSNLKILQNLNDMYFTYIVECSDGSLYVGCTNDLAKRIKQHNESRWGAHYTKIRRPVVLKYFETFENLKKARKRESEIKGWRREKKENLIKAMAA